MFLFGGLVWAFHLTQTELSIGDFLPPKPNRPTKRLFSSGFGPQVATTQASAVTKSNNLDPRGTKLCLLLRFRRQVLTGLGDLFLLPHLEQLTVNLLK